MKRLPDRTLVHFLHIGKTGGSAIKYALREHLVSPRYQLQLRGHRIALSDIPPGDKAFFFLRDPVSRFVSGFYSRQRCGQPRRFVEWTPAERQAFTLFETANQLALALSSQDEREQQNAREAMRSITHLQTHYADWFGDQSYLLSRREDLFYIGFQETLSADFERLRTKLGLDPTVTLPEDEVNSHRNPSTVDKNLDCEATANLREWYADDYQYLALCHELAESVNSAG